MAELLDKDHDNFNDDEDLDLDRYDSAAGWDGSDADEPGTESNTKTNSTPASPTHKTRYAHHRHLPHESMFEVRPANAAMRTEPPVDLVPGLWRTGELALLIGEPGIGKSLLAVQIAESIARGVHFGSSPYEGGVDAFRGRGGSLPRSPSIRDPQSATRTQEVLLLDLDQTDAQFAERYTCPSPFPGRRPVKYRFSPKLIRPSYRDFGSIPEEFNDSLTKFFNASIDEAIAESGAKVIIIDNLAALSPYARNNSAHIRMFNALKLHATTRNLSILVIHSSPAPRRPGRPAAQGQYRLRERVGSFGSPPCPVVGLPQHWPSSARPERGVDAFRGRGGSLSSPLSGNSPLSILNSQLANIADSVFAICPTTFGPEYRYIKLLKTKQVDNGQLKVENGGSENSSLVTGPSSLSDEVACFQLARVSSPISSPPCLGEVPAGRGGSSSSDSSLVTRNGIAVSGFRLSRTGIRGRISPRLRSRGPRRRSPRTLPPQKAPAQLKRNTC